MFVGASFCSVFVPNLEQGVLGHERLLGAIVQITSITFMWVCSDLKLKAKFGKEGCKILSKYHWENSPHWPFTQTHRDSRLVIGWAGFSGGFPRRIPGILLQTNPGVALCQTVSLVNPVVIQVF